jgi:hypothetical protein
MQHYIGTFLYDNIHAIVYLTEDGYEIVDGTGVERQREDVTEIMSLREAQTDFLRGNKGYKLISQECDEPAVRFDIFGLNPSHTNQVLNALKKHDQTFREATHDQVFTFDFFSFTDCFQIRVRPDFNLNELVVQNIFCRVM